MNKKIIFLLLITSTLATRCKKDDPESEPALIKISGTLDLKKESNLTPDTKIYILWASEQGEYVFGRGSIDYEAKTFSIVMKDSIPEAAMHSENFGIGFIFASNNPGIEEKLYEEGFIDEEMVKGAAGGFCIIFKKSSEVLFDSWNQWSGEFGKGYTVGKGYEIPDEYDGFMPFDKNSVVLIIDDLNNIEFTNWS